MTARVVYGAGVVLIFAVEVAIAMDVIGGAFIRGSVGDILVIALIYCALRAALGLAPARAAGLAIASGLVAELLQYVHLAELLGLSEGSVLYTLIGNTYSSSDLVMYTIGGLLALAADHIVLIPRVVDRRS